jgi:hypothetical protein
MKLTILERFLSLGLLPEQGNITKIRLRQEMSEKVGFSPEEIERYEIKQNEGEGTVQWRMDLPQEKEIDLKVGEMNVVREALEKLSSEEKLTPNHLSLYEKFVE